jgi:cytochrome c
MDDRFNTIAGWTLFSGVVALGLASVSSHYFRATKENRPEKMGYEIEGVVQEGEGGAAAVPLETLLASADAAKGEATFKKCASCHTATAGGANGIGPNLHGVLGEGVAVGRGGYAFSDALKTHGGKWDWATMDAWLKNPKAFAPGTKMSFAGLGDAAERANLLVYLNTQGSNLPLPAAPAAPAADAAAPAEGAAAPAEGAAAAPAAEPAKK